MRKIHRTIGLFFAPFLAISAVTGLLWAYAPYLYMKNEAPKASVTIDENGTYLPIAEVVRSARKIAPEGRITNVALKASGDRFVYTVYVGSKKGQQEVRVDAADSKAELVVPTTSQKIHYWVKKLHEFQFFGTKKELTAFSGLSLSALLVTGFFLLRKKVK